MRPLGTSWAWPLRRFTEGGGEHQNDVTGRAERGEGGVMGTDCAEFAPGDAWGGGGRGLIIENRTHLPFSLCFPLSFHSLLQLLFRLLLAGCEALSR